jgi:hypothetical protein
VANYSNIGASGPALVRECKCRGASPPRGAGVVRVAGWRMRRRQPVRWIRAFIASAARTTLRVPQTSPQAEAYLQTNYPTLHAQLQLILPGRGGQR